MPPLNEPLENLLSENGCKHLLKSQRLVKRADIKGCLIVVADDELKMLSTGKKKTPSDVFVIASPELILLPEGSHGFYTLICNATHAWYFAFDQRTKTLHCNGGGQRQNIDYSYSGAPSRGLYTPKKPEIITEMFGISIPQF